MDGCSAGRAGKTYIPDCLVPHDPESGRLIKPNAFDNRYFSADGDMREGQKAVISTRTAFYPARQLSRKQYVTALDLCLQGLINPQPLG